MRAIYSSLLVACGLAACEPAPNKTGAAACPDPDIACKDELAPQPTSPAEVPLKLNGAWYFAKREYGAFGNTLIFFWPSRMPAKAPGADYLLRRGVDYHDLAIEVFLRSTHVPTKPQGYRFIEAAIANGSIAETRQLREGLVSYRIRDPAGTGSPALLRETWYVASTLKGPDGLPPVAVCDHSSAQARSGTGFMWRDGIWAGVRMNQRHCKDWPEINAEIRRVLDTVRKAD